MHTEEEEEGKEAEPRLKYSPFYPSSTTTVSSGESLNFSCCAATDRFVALGSLDGKVILMDAQGNIIKEWNNVHSKKINCLVIDSTMEYLASGSEDGTVVISSLFSPDHSTFTFKQPILAVSLEPGYGKKSSKQFICGGAAGNLTSSAKGTINLVSVTTLLGWFAQSQQTLHSGQGAILQTSWHGSFIIWATENGGVYALDTTSWAKIGNLEKPSDVAHDSKCSLSWISDTEYLIGWGKYVKVISIKASETGTKSLQVLHQFQTDFDISGVASFQSNILLLSSLITVAPELYIMDFTGTIQAKDYLPLDQTLQQGQTYHLSSYLFNGEANEIVHDTQEHSFYVCSLNQVVVAKPRDVRDHVNWLISQSLFQQALDAVISDSSSKQYIGREKDQIIQDIGRDLVSSLMSRKEFTKAAETCRDTFHGPDCKTVWESTVVQFAEFLQLQTLSSHIPTKNPQLSPQMYEMVLMDFLKNDLDGLLQLIKTWPSSIYNIKGIIDAVEIYLGSSETTTTANDSKPILYEILAELYELNRQVDKAIYYSLLLNRKDQADRIEKENLFSFLKGNVLLVMNYALYQTKKRLLEESKSGDPTPVQMTRATSKSKEVTLLILHQEYVSVDHCVSSLKQTPKLLHIYLDALFSASSDPSGPTLVTSNTTTSNVSVHDLQVPLYAEYDPTRLIEFLRTASYFSYPQAYKVCEERDLVPEMMYLLGKMGDNRKALYLIIERVGDVDMAIEFAKEQNDESLWDEFLKFAIDKPPFIVGLLCKSTGHIDPLRIIEKIPNTLAIPNLKSALIHIMSDCSVQLSLRKGCEKILQSDIWSTFTEFTKTQRGGTCLLPDSKCCTCEESITDPKDHLIVFCCWHSFHASCIKADITLVDDSADGQDKKASILLDKSIDLVYNRSPIALHSNSSTTLMWIDTKRIRCPICTS